MPCATSRAPRATSSRPASTAPCRRPPKAPTSRRACTTGSRRSSTTSRAATSTATSSPRSSAPRARARCAASPCRTSGVRLVRDRFNVPHIYGKTDDDVTWGAGWALAQDRELLLEQARYNSRVAVVDAPGPERDRPDRRPEELHAERADRARGRTRRSTKLKRYGKPGRRLLHDIDVYVKGINAYYKEHEERGHKPWTRRDVIALNAVKSQLFGEGGGDEVAGGRVPRRARRSALGADKRLLGLERPPPAPGPGDDRLDPGQLPLRAAARRSAPGTRRRQQLVPAGRPSRGVDAPRGARELRAGHASNVLMVAGQALHDRPPAVRRRAADRLLLPRPDARDGPARARLERARRDLGAVPRLHPDRRGARTSSGR